MNTQKRYPREVRQRAVRMVLEHKGEYDSQGAAIGSVATKLGMIAETLGKWVRRSSGSIRSARCCRTPLPPTMPRRPASRKVWRELGRQGFQVARCTVERLMRALGNAYSRRILGWTASPPRRARIWPWTLWRWPSGGAAAMFTA